MDLSDDEIPRSPTLSSPSGRSSQQTSPRDSPPPPPIWLLLQDDSTGEAYYFNEVTEERAWELPAGVQTYVDTTDNDKVVFVSGREGAANFSSDDDDDDRQPDDDGWDDDEDFDSQGVEGDNQDDGEGAHDTAGDDDAGSNSANPDAMDTEFSEPKSGLLSSKAKAVNILSLLPGVAPALSAGSSASSLDVPASLMSTDPSTLLPTSASLLVASRPSLAASRSFLASPDAALTCPTTLLAHYNNVCDAAPGEQGGGREEADKLLLSGYSDASSEIAILASWLYDISVPQPPPAAKQVSSSGSSDQQPPPPKLPPPTVQPTHLSLLHEVSQTLYVALAQHAAKSYDPILGDVLAQQRDVAACPFLQPLLAKPAYVPLVGGDEQGVVDQETRKSVRWPPYGRLLLADLAGLHPDSALLSYCVTKVSKVGGGIPLLPALRSGAATDEVDTCDPTDPAPERELVKALGVHTAADHFNAFDLLLRKELLCLVSPSPLSHVRSTSAALEGAVEAAASSPLLLAVLSDRLELLADELERRIADEKVERSSLTRALKIVRDASDRLAAGTMSGMAAPPLWERAAIKDLHQCPLLSYAPFSPSPPVPSSFLAISSNAEDAIDSKPAALVACLAQRTRSDVAPSSKRRRFDRPSPSPESGPPSLPQPGSKQSLHILPFFAELLRLRSQGDLHFDGPSIAVAAATALRLGPPPSLSAVRRVDRLIAALLELLFARPDGFSTLPSSRVADEVITACAELVAYLSPAFFPIVAITSSHEASSSSQQQQQVQQNTIKHMLIAASECCPALGNMMSFTLPPPDMSKPSPSNLQLVSNALHSSPIVAIGILTWAEGFSRSSAFRTDEVRSLFSGLLSLARIASFHHHSSSQPGASQCVRSAFALTVSMLSNPPASLGIEQTSLYRKLCLRNMVCFAARGIPLEVVDYLTSGVASDKEMSSTFDSTSVTFNALASFSSSSSPTPQLDPNLIRSFVEDLVEVVSPDASSLSHEFAYALLRFFAISKCQSSINSELFRKEGPKKIEAVRAIISSAAKKLDCDSKAAEDLLLRYGGSYARK